MALIKKCIFNYVIKPLTLQYEICNNIKPPLNMKPYLNTTILNQHLFKIFKLKL